MTTKQSIDIRIAAYMECAAIAEEKAEVIGDLSYERCAKDILHAIMLLIEEGSIASKK